MKPPLPRILSDVPRTLHAQLEVAKAIRMLMAPGQDQQSEWLKKSPIVASQREEIAEIIRDALQILRKAGFNPDEPRVPAGDAKGGQWTRDDTAYASGGTLFDANPDDLWTPSAQYVANNPPGTGHNQGPPLEGTPPSIPPRPPETRRGLNLFIKAAAYWLAAIGKAAAARYLRLLQAIYWVATRALPYIRAYLSAPKSLKELQQDVLNPQIGYDIHHVVEQTSARDDGFSDDMIDGADNLVRIPTLKHWQISAWYQIRNEKYGGLSPRNYLRGKTWEERYRVGIDALIRFGVLKP